MEESDNDSSPLYGSPSHRRQLSRCVYHNAPVSFRVSFLASFLALYYG